MGSILVRTGTIRAFGQHGDDFTLRTDDGQMFGARRADYCPQGFVDRPKAVNHPSVNTVNHHCKKRTRIAFVADEMTPSGRVHRWTFCDPGTIRLQVEIVAEKPREFWCGHELADLQKTFPRHFEDRSADGAFLIQLNHVDIVTWLRANSGTVTDEERDLLWQEGGKSAWFEMLVGQVWYRTVDPRLLPTMAPRPECTPPARPRQHTPWR